ncbi:NADPH-dependent FMN reductase [Aerococcus kribbianus]|uniref:NAD(P)H-dependent oxidoreductase n=1 Tax=Aerococcus kribbianus TaxID=2999064 RepID=A0A9X3FPQ6_9LACT|nr:MULTISPECIES: NADPH-dependent FMN reductase [unclassified Aerococcus]MCZ0717448.1 NAD(P)H-dependent oxidoreductase [Aerococcus sp. YH-aer221]MCZ0725736.1 NAD(P)H-dependent oxidoreductase [Aerococcus sp. YH-aer222]
MNILVLSGSNVGNKTRIATQALYEQLSDFTDSEVSINYLNVQDLDLMFSDGRHFLDYTGDTGRLVQAVMDSDLIFIGTPIFQASIPASLKNVFDLLPQKALERKTVGILVTAGSNKHYLIPEIQLKPILSYLKASIVPNYLFIHDTAFDHEKLIDDDVYFRLQTLIQDSLILARAMQNAWQEQDDAFDF